MFNPTTGKDTTVDLLANGVSVFDEAVQNLNIDPVFDDIRTKHLGTTKPTVDMIPNGYNITMTISTRDFRFKTQYRLYEQAKEQNLPFVWTLLVTETSRDPAEAPMTDTYSEIELTAGEGHIPGQANATSLTIAAAQRN